MMITVIAFASVVLTMTGYLVVDFISDEIKRYKWKKWWKENTPK